MQIEEYQVIVIGGGVYGLSTAYQLAKKELRVALFDQFTIGHHQGSSHSLSRIIRCTYQKEVYRDLAITAFNQDWPLMEQQLGCKLILPNPFVYYDDTNQYTDYLKVAQANKDKTQQIIVLEDLNKKYPSLPNIQTNNKPIIDKKGGVILAQIYMKKLKQKLQSMSNVTIFEHTTVKNVSSNEKNVTVETDEQNIIAEKVVVASGRWLSKLIPEFTQLVKPVKQHIVYLQMDKPQEYVVGKYPCWVHQDSDGQFFSLPSTADEGVKIGEHQTKMSIQYEQNKQIIMKKLQKKIKQYFGNRVKQIKSYEECWYTITKTQDFIIDWGDQSERVLICSACSGHGFKFAPLIGRIISDLCQQDESIKIFEKDRHLFRIPYHQGINLQ